MRAESESHVAGGNPVIVVVIGQRGPRNLNMNPIFRNITVENYQELVRSFKGSRAIFWDDEAKKLIHPGEYGEHREDILKRFLNLYIPETFGIESGFLINAAGDISSQCDVIIYDKSRTPRIHNLENQRFFPIETVLGVGEVKSTISSMADLNRYLTKLAATKALRLRVPHPVPYRRGSFKAKFDPTRVFSDNIFTFLLCYEFGFALDVEKLNYGDIGREQWHNMVLSLKNGLISYQTAKTKNLCFAHCGDSRHDHWFLRHDGSELPATISIFLAALSLFENNTALLEFQADRYLTDNVVHEVR